MKIKNHKLIQDNDTPIPYEASPNCGGAVQQKLLIIHFTAGRSASSSISWLKNPEAKASAHLVIGRDGGITQLVPFNKKAWHAGRSRWGGLVGINKYSIGIELDNAGQLQPQGTQWRAWFGGTYSDDEVIEAIHKYGHTSCGWHVYTPEQMESLRQASKAIAGEYGIEEILGHEDISRGRKFDPGPAFPMDNFKSAIFGRQDDDDGRYKTSTELNIRTGPGTQYEKLEGGPLPKNTKVIVMESEGNWRFVDVLNTVNNEMDLEGWVHGRYLIRG